MVALSWERVTHRFREPLQTAFGTLLERETLVVKLEGADGSFGVGEAAPLEPYDGVPLAAVETALSAYARVIAELDDGPAILAACQETTDLPQALAAIDIALWDRAGRREGARVCDLLIEAALDAVPVNATIGALAPRAAGRAAAAAVTAGFSCVKVKVGSGDDLGRLAAVRSTGPGLAIRIDANGVWTAAQAIALLPALAEAAGGLEIVEEPVHGRSELQALAAALPGLRIASDESGPGAAGTVCLKLSRSGGIGALLAQAAYVRASGGEVYLASTFDGPVGIAAAVHAASALGIELPCGLATLDAFAEQPPDRLRPRLGTIAVPAGSGLGIES